MSTLITITNGNRSATVSLSVFLRRFEFPAERSAVQTAIDATLRQDSRCQSYALPHSAGRYLCAMPVNPDGTCNNMECPNHRRTRG